MLCRVHTAYLRAVFLAAAGGISRAYALNEYNSMRVLSVGGAEKLTRCRTCRIGKSFELQARYHVLALRVCKFVIFFQTYGIVARSRHNCAVLFLDYLVLLLVVDSPRRADLGANAALAVFEHIAVIGVDSRNLGNSLCKGNINSPSVIHSEVKFVGNVLLGAFFRADAAAGAFGRVHIPCLFLYLHREIAHKAAYRLNLAVCVNMYLLILSAVYHFR